MKVATYNLHFGGSGKEKNHLDRLFSDSGADIAFVQEAFDPKSYPVSYPIQEAVWHSVENMNWGSGIVTRNIPIEEFPLPVFNGWVIAGRVFCEGQEILLVNVHNPSNKMTYLENLIAILDSIKELKYDNIIIGGDFNISLGRRLPSEPLKSNSEDRRGLALLEGMGLIQAWRLMNPGMPLAQTLRWSKDPALPFHIDCFFINKTLADRVTSCSVLLDPGWTGMSDHNPLAMEFSRLDSVQGWSRWTPSSLT
jgi:endonuclease/exonuclease/phosphatase family metal-dependent hydrolase